MNYAYQRRGGPLLRWNGVRPPAGTRAGETRSLGAFLEEANLGEFREEANLGSYMPIPGHPERIGDIDWSQYNPTPLERVMAMAGGAVGTYHGYKRNQSIGWALAWGLLGAVFPLSTTAIALAQGIGQPKGKPDTGGNGGG